MKHSQFRYNLLINDLKSIITTKQIHNDWFLSHAIDVTSGEIGYNLRYLSDSHMNDSHCLIVDIINLR